MSLSPVIRKARRRRIEIYDLEWVPADERKAKAHGFTPLALRLCGHFDGKRYRSYTNVGEFLNAVCTQQKSGTWFYAHFGGRSDLIFLLEYLVANPKPYIRVECAFSGSAAIIVKLIRGRSHWYFVDSFWLIRQPLREIGEWLGMKKGGDSNSTDQFYVGLKELTEYNEQDCRILYTAIRTFEDRILELGGELQKTVASTAMALFRRRFLKQTINIDERINVFAREAYFASRVEVHALECTSADYYDVNSSFPFAMTFDCPGNIAREGKRLRAGEMGLVHATVKVPECSVPPIPYRGTDFRVYFPTGIWKSWLSNIDIELLEEQGGSVEKVHQAVAFEPFSDLKGYAETVYAWRKETSDPALKIILKFLLNSLYGKFGEGRQKQKVWVNPPEEFFEIEEREPGGLGREMLMPGVWALVEDKDIAHAHVPIAVHITARARALLTRYMIEAEKVYYCDTDGFAVPAPGPWGDSEELGALKKERHIYRARFAAPKFYALDTDVKNKDTGKLERKWVVKGKGFSRIRHVDSDGNVKTARLSYEDFIQLQEQKEVQLESFASLKTLWRRGEIKPAEIISPKRWRNTVRPKRAPESDGVNTRAWNVKELGGKWKKAV